MTTRRRTRPEPGARTFARISEQPLHERVLDLAAPLLERLGAGAPADAVRDAIEIAILFWNARARASKVWGPVETEPLSKLQKTMTGTIATTEDAEQFALLEARWRAKQLAFDPRLVGEWSLDIGPDGDPRLSCTMALPAGVEAEAPPPIEARIAIGGQFLDEVRIPTQRSGRAVVTLKFPRERHVGSVGDDGTLIVRTPMPVVAALLVDGVLPPKGEGAVDVLLCGETLKSMVLRQLRCESQERIAALVFEHQSIHANRSGTSDRW